MEENLQLLALSEVRWPGNGVSNIGGMTVIHSGVEVGMLQSCWSGVAMVLSKGAADAWRAAGSVYSVSDRLLRVHLKSHIGLCLS